MLGGRALPSIVAAGLFPMARPRSWFMFAPMESYLLPKARPGWAASLRGLLQFPAGHRSPSGAKLAWLVKLRWAALLLAFLSAAPAVYSGLLPRENLAFYIGILSCTGLFNLLTQLFISQRTAAASHELLTLQMIYDLFAVTALLRLTGGLANPAAVLFYLHVVLGGLLLQRGRSWLFLLSLHAALAWLQAASFRLPLAQQSIEWLILPHVMVLLFWACVHMVGKHLDLQHGLLLSATVAAEKQDRLRALGALAAGFSHEFASPLQTLRLRLDRLGRLGAPGEDLTAAQAALEDCTRVLHAMNQSQLDSRAGTLTLADLSRLSTELAGRWTGESGRAVEIVSSPKLMAKIQVLSFAQTLINLLDNAAEAAPEGSVTLSMREESGEICLTVRDQGPGFPRAVLDRLGEPFNTTKPAGTGLGLYVAELFAQSVGGTFRARNLKEGGAEAELRLPGGAQ